MIGFSRADPLPDRIASLGISETPWFLPGDLESGFYLIQDLSGGSGSPEELVVVVDGGRSVVYLAYSWN